MRNYMILNGVNSQTITGLLIQELPPISKPKQRVEVEEIDGRDGDIITKLGYSAYNKKISIGLYGNYNVDDVIAYFTNNQSGKVIFSNEPDKYYNFEILEQVDFDRLIRYKTATVTLHCQPFKYSTTENKIQINATEVSGSGSNITLNNTENGALFTNLKINGDTSQTGTPEPNNQVNVDTITGDNTINISNSFLTSNNYLQDNAYFRSTDTIFHGTDNAKLIYVEIEPNTTYSVHRSSILQNNFGVATSVNEPRNGVAITKVVEDTTGNTITITSGSNDNYLSVYCYWSSSSITFEKVLKTLSISKGEYQEQNYQINLGTLELCKIGDYQDYIYKSNGNWYLHKVTGKFIFNGGENWSVWSPDDNRTLTSIFTLSQSVIGNNYISSNETASYCNYFKDYGSGTTYRRDYDAIALNIDTTRTLQIAIQKSLLSTDDVNGFKSWLSSHNIVVYYPLSTPTTEEITDSDLINQLEALINATTYLGQTKITTSGDNLDPLLDVTTYSVDNPSFTITNSGNVYSKPIITIYGLGTVGLYLNGVQVLNLNLGETTSQITIDVANLEAYNQETGALMNRNVTGDYNNLTLNVGNNIITESGTLQGIEIENYSRWL